MSLSAALQNREFLLNWVGGAFAIWIVAGVLVGTQTVLSMLLMYFLPDGMLGEMALAAVTVLIAGATVGLVMGYVQYRLMKQHGCGIFDWIPVTVAGGVVATVLMVPSTLLMSDPLSPHLLFELVPMPMFMLVMGIAQWFVLRKYTPYAPLWIVACVLSALAFSLLHIELWPVAVAVQSTILGLSCVALMRTMTRNAHYDS